jgi:DHA1 family solute carrier family 18 vesicular amine transporter 1/2
VSPVAHAKSWHVTGVVAFAFFMDYLIYGLVVPLTLYSPAGISGQEEFGLLYGGYALGVLAATPLFGYFGSRVGLKRLMICGVALSAAATMLFWLAPNFALMLLARLLQGAASAGTWTAGLSMIAAHHVERRVEMMGYALMGSTAGSVLGPVAGGVLYDAGGYSLPFLVTILMVGVDAVLRIFVLPADRAGAESNAKLGALLLDRSVLIPGAAVGLAAIGWGIVEPTLPSQLGRAGVTPAAIGLIFTISAIAYGLSAPLVSWVSERVALKKVIAGGTVAMAIALPLLSLYGGDVGVTIGLCLVSISYAFMLNPTSAELGDAVDRRGMTCYSAVYAIYNVAYSVGMLGTNAFASIASSRLSFLQILLCVSAALVIATPFLLRDSAAPSTAPQPSVQE